MGLNRKRKIITKLLIGLTVAISGLFLLSFSSSRPATLGVRNGKLSELPTTPNCVSSQSLDPARRMPPIPFSGTPTAVRNRIRQIVQQLPRTKIISETPVYLHVECSSAVFRFVDDVEFLFDDSANLVHFRSAARVGYSDLGINRKRMARIARMYAETASNQQKMDRHAP